MDEQEERKPQSDNTVSGSDNFPDMEVILDGSEYQDLITTGDRTNELNIDPATLAWIFLTATFGSSFLKSFATELGRRFGGTTADWLGRIHARVKRDGSSVTGFVIDPPPLRERIIFELREPLTDEAKLALLDLDVYAVHGKTFRWNIESKAWEVLDATSQSS